MKNKITSIIEAFSMQPFGYHVTPPTRRNTFNPDDDIERIELEVMDEHNNVYVGYNFKGNKKFQYLANSVNVHYE